MPRVAYSSHTTSAACIEYQHTALECQRDTVSACFFLRFESGSLLAYREGRRVLYLVQRRELGTVKATGAILPYKIWIVV